MSPLLAGWRVTLAGGRGPSGLAVRVAAGALGQPSGPCRESIDGMRCAHILAHPKRGSPSQQLYTPCHDGPQSYPAGPFATKEDLAALVVAAGASVAPAQGGAGGGAARTVRGAVRQEGEADASAESSVVLVDLEAWAAQGRRKSGGGLQVGRVGGASAWGGGRAPGDSHAPVNGERDASQRGGTAC